MNGIKYLLDTCFILEFHRHSADTLQTIANKNIQSSECAISVVNRLEVLGYANITPDDERCLNVFLENFYKINVNLAIENKVIELRKHHKIKLPDAIILATALTHRLELLSLDSGLMNKYRQYVNP